MLTRTRLIILLVLFAVVAAAFATFALLPRRYLVAEQLSGIDVFWHEDEAFVFVGHHAMGRSTNAVLDRLSESGAWAALGAMWADWRELGHGTNAWRVAEMGLERHELADTVMVPSWDLEEGHLVARARTGTESGRGFAWTGEEFVRLGAEDVAPGSRKLLPDDEADLEDLGTFVAISPESRERLKGAGWHFKHLTGYEALQGPVELPIALPSRTWTLSLRSQRSVEAAFPFTTRVELSEEAPEGAELLFESGGWKEVPRADFEARSVDDQRPSSFPTSMLVLLLVWLGFLVLKVGGVAGGAGFLAVFGLRRKLTKSVATTMSFPPAIPEQFPKLDHARLEVFSRDLEGLGFEKLLDSAPVTDSPTHPPTFCRIYAQPQHACFGVIMQPFPTIGGPIELRCLLNGEIEGGWSVGVANGKPMAASAFVRRPRAIGATFPAASPAELFSRFLRFRDQVSADLGVRPIADTGLETYIRRTQESLAEIREAMKRKSMVVSLGQYCLNVLGLRRKRSQLVWLGDYPKVAEERKAAGLGPGFRGTDMWE